MTTSYKSDDLGCPSAALELTERPIALKRIMLRERVALRFDRNGVYDHPPSLHALRKKRDDPCLRNMPAFRAMIQRHIDQMEIAMKRNLPPDQRSAAQIVEDATGRSIVATRMKPPGWC